METADSLPGGKATGHSSACRPPAAASLPNDNVTPAADCGETIPSGPINPTNGHPFTNLNVNIGGGKKHSRVNRIVNPHLFFRLVKP